MKHSHHLALLWDNYTPAKKIPELTLNAASTLAAEYAQSLVHTGIDSTVAIAQSHLWMGRHIQPDGTLDPRTTMVGDLSVGSNGYQNNLLLGLFHVGLSRLAAEEGDGLGRFSTLHLLEYLAKDMNGNAVLDGNDAHGDRVVMGQYPLSSETLRLKLAHATRRWLENSDLHGQPTGFSKSDLNQFDRPGRYLRSLTSSNAPIFGVADVPEFDDRPPRLTVRIRGEGKNWSQVPEEETMRGLIEIRVDAVDETDVRTLSVSVEGSEYQPQCARLVGIGTGAAFGEYTWNSRDASNGPVTLLVTAADSLGNKTKPAEHFELTVDNAPPIVTVPDILRSRTGEMQIRGSVDKSYAVLHVTQDGNEIVSQRQPLDAEQQGPQDFSVDLTLACDASHSLLVFAEDEAGNRSEGSLVKVLCDTYAPVLGWVPTSFHQEFSGQQVSVSNGALLEKHLHRLGAEDDNLPEIAWHIDDQPQGRVGSAMKDVSVEYAFAFVSNGRMRQTEWSRVAVEQSDRYPAGWGYAVKISYESMLPAEIKGLDAYTLRNANYVARSKVGDKHMLLVRSTDEFGNRSENSTVEFGLDIRSAPVTISCQRSNRGYEDATNLTFIPIKQMAALAETKDRNLRVHMRWNIPDGEKVSQLSPPMGDAYMSVRMPDMTQTVFVHDTLRQVAVLNRTHALNDNEGAWCSDGGARWARTWSDGQCEPHSDDPADGTWKTRQRVKLVQALSPLERTVIIRGADTSSMIYQAQSPLPLEWQTTLDGRRRLQYRFRSATDYERHGGLGNPDRAWLDERLFAFSGAMTTTLPAPTVIAGDFPLPSKIEVDSTCFQNWIFSDRP